MASINCLPLELLTEIFSYLPRRDRIACSMVCVHWETALNSPCLWKNMVICLDSDLIESSTITATKYYHEHFHSMEFCWANPRLPFRWLQCGLQEFSKKVCRYIMILQDSYVQLNAVRIVDWYEVPKFKKVTYHLCKFLRSQLNLAKVSFFNVNFSKTECVKLLAACLASFNTIKYLDIGNCRHANPAMFESVSFISCLEHLSHLRVLKLDYTALSAGAIEAIITSRNTELKLLDVTVRDCDQTTFLIPEERWQMLHLQCPTLEVSMHLKNVCHFDDIYLLLRETIPLTTFSLSCGKIWDQTRSRQYRRTILLLIKNYNRTLENLHLQINYNREVLDDLILTVIHKCINLKQFDFYGVIESMELIREICRIQSDNKDGFKYFNVIPSDMNPESHYLLTELHRDFAEKLESCNVDFRISNTSNRNLVYVYY